MPSDLPSLCRYCGVLGCLIILVAIGLAAASYRGRQNERYSVLNHFVSELGEEGISRKAQVFNGGLVAGGLALLPFIVWLGLRLDSLWGVLALVSGLGMAGACIAVGVFPMNNLAPHVVAATSFFRLGLIAVLLFGVAVLAQPAENIVVPLATNLPAGLAVLAYAGILGLVGRATIQGETVDEVMNTALLVDRPRIWALPVLEWSVLATTLTWILGVALFASA